MRQSVGRQVGTVGWCDSVFNVDRVVEAGGWCDSGYVEVKIIGGPGVSDLAQAPLVEIVDAAEQVMDDGLVDGHAALLQHNLVQNRHTIRHHTAVRVLRFGLGGGGRYRLVNAKWADGNR